MTYEAARLKVSQLDTEIRASEASSGQKSNMLHSLSKLWMFASDSLLSDNEAVDLADRVASMRAWAESRITHCREQENKFGDAWVHRDRHHHGPPQALVEAWTERRALQAVLETLDAEKGGGVSDG